MEMKKSYSPFGSTPLSVDEVLPDIQTGRAVYSDKDKEADASYMERINQYKHEGFHDVSEDGGSSGGASIPTPTVEDAGKSVVVNDEGQYALTNSGGGTALIIREERTEETADGKLFFYYDKTYQEVKDAYDAGLPIYLQLYNNEVQVFERVSLIAVSDPTSENYSVTVINLGTTDTTVMSSDSADGQLVRRIGK